MSQALIIRHKGLYTAPNEFSAAPPGALLLANNCVLNDNNILESRRGNEEIFTLPTASDRAIRFEFYQNKQILAIAGGSGNKIGYDNSGLALYSGTYSDPDSTQARRRFLLANNNLYFTSSTGVFRLDAFNGTPTLSGMYAGLDIQGSTTGSSGFLSNNNQVAYRVLWGIKDASLNIIRGAPSGREVVINSTGGARDVSLTVTIPSGVTTSHFLQVYRSKASGGVAISPSDELQLVYENNPSSAEITAGSLTFTDATPDDLRGEALYTNPSQQGIRQSNERPPLAWDVATFEGSTFYANIESKHRLFLTQLSASSIDYDDTLTIAGTTYTAKAVEAAASGHYSLHKDADVVGDTNGNTTIDNVADFTGVEVGREISGTDIPASTTITAFDSGAGTITISQSATGSSSTVTFTVSTGGTAAQDLADTARSLVRVINQYSSNTSVYARYLSGETDLPGKILIEERGLGGAAFSATASANGTAFNPVLPTSGTSVSSSNDDYQHGIMFSKTDQSEAVPLQNLLFAGSANKAILRILPLRNSLFIFKENEGIYRITGTDATTFRVELFDSSANLIAPDSLAVVNNQIWGLSDQGIMVVTETGVSVVSRPIEDQILDQFGDAIDAVKQYSFGVAYETDRKYILWTVSGASETVPTQAFVFNTFTEGFTRWPISKSAAYVNKADDRLYLGDGNTNSIEKERKSRTFTDYIDEAFTVTITSVDGNDVYLSSTADVEVGDLLWESATVYSRVSAVEPAFITVEDERSWAISSATVYKGINCEVEYAAITGDNPGVMKHFPEVSMLFREADFNSATIAFSTDESTSFENVTISGETEGTWGLSPWGEGPWGATANTFPIRILTPLEKCRGSLFRIRFTHRQGYGNFKLNGISVPIIDTGSFKLGSA